MKPLLEQPGVSRLGCVVDVGLLDDLNVDKTAEYATRYWQAKR